MMTCHEVGALQVYSVYSPLKISRIVRVVYLIFGMAGGLNYGCHVLPYFGDFWRMIRSPATNWKRFPASMIFKIETINQTNFTIKLELFMDDSRLQKKLTRSRFTI